MINNLIRFTFVEHIYTSVPSNLKANMISQLESEKQNLQSSLLFMQQEHSNTLRALHEEIAGLQKKCRGIITNYLVTSV